MGKFEDMFAGAKISNFDELFSKTKTVAESINKKSSQAFDLSRKRFEYLDVKAKLSKFYEKYGKLQFSAYLGEEFDEGELDMLIAQITAYRDKLNTLKAELEEVNDNSELKREAEELKKEVIIASHEAKEVIKKQMDEMYKNARNAFNKSAQSVPKSDPFKADDDSVYEEADEEA